MKTVAFRVDGGPQIGMGHIMRCLSLAREFKRSGYKVFFISKLKDGIEKIQQEKFDIILLSHKKREKAIGFNYGINQELDSDLKEIINIINCYSINVLIVDSYNITENYLLGMKRCATKIAYIDDINKFKYPVDILINGNITAEYMNYERYSKDEILLLGPKYNLIRDEFRNLPTRSIRQEVNEIMITTGGSDPYNMSSKLLNSILQNKEIDAMKINVIVGNSFINKQELQKISMVNANIILHENVKNMSKIMLNSDLAISSGGSTLYELCACGTPTLAFVYAENQRLIVEKMNELGYVKSIGWYDKLSDYQLNMTVIDVLNDYEYRLGVSSKQKDLFDQKGVVRVVNIFNDIL